MKSDNQLKMKRLSVRALKSVSHHFNCFNDSLSKMMKNAFHFILKSSFLSRDIYIFVLTTGLILKFMTSQPG